MPQTKRVPRPVSSSDAAASKVALTPTGAPTATVQVGTDPAQPFPQVAKPEAESGEAVRVTEEPSGYTASHVVPHERPGGEAEIVPSPVPSLVIVSGKPNVARALTRPVVVTVRAAEVPAEPHRP